MDLFNAANAPGMMVSGPGTVIFTGLSVAAWALRQSAARNGAPGLSGANTVGTAACQLPPRMVRTVSCSKSNPSRWRR